MPPYRIDWLDDARADIRSLDRTTAMYLFDGVLRFAELGIGNIKALQGSLAGALRLRIGDYRILPTFVG